MITDGSIVKLDIRKGYPFKDGIIVITLPTTRKYLFMMFSLFASKNHKQIFPWYLNAVTVSNMLLHHGVLLLQWRSRDSISISRWSICFRIFKNDLLGTKCLMIYYIKNTPLLYLMKIEKYLLWFLSIKQCTE